MVMFVFGTQFLVLASESSRLLLPVIAYTPALGLFRIQTHQKFLQQPVVEVVPVPLILHCEFGN
jgi:hypothetical protein